MKEKQLLFTAQAIEYLGCSRQVIDRAIRDGKLKVEKHTISGLRQFTIEELDRFRPYLGKRGRQRASQQNP